jgi:hypothetical protein
VKARAVRRDALAASSLPGAVLSHDVPGDPPLRKGRVLRPDDVGALLARPWDELHVLDMDADDVHEDEAGARLAHAAAGAGVGVGDPSAGHWPLVARVRGLLSVRTGALDACNIVDGVCVYTHLDGRVVDVGETVARAKVTPLVLEGWRVRAAEGVAQGAGGLVAVRPFAAHTLGVVVQETLDARARARLEGALGEKMGWLGTRMLPFVHVRRDAGELVSALAALRDGGADVLAVAGTRAMDALDPAFVALGTVGATMVRYGVPAHPGSLFWLARLGELPILGMPTCGLFSQATVFDMLFPRLLAGDALDHGALSALGHGGLLTREMSYRFPPYRGASQARGEIPDDAA